MHKPINGHTQLVREAISLLFIVCLCSLLQASLAPGIFFNSNKDAITIRSFARYYHYPHEGSSLCGIIDDNVTLAIQKHRPGWIKVNYRGVEGWIAVSTITPSSSLRAQTEAENMKPLVLLKNLSPMLALFLWIGIVVLSTGSFLFFFNYIGPIKMYLLKWFTPKVYIGKEHVILFATEVKKIQSTVTNRVQSMRQYLLHKGYLVHRTNSPKKLKMLYEKFQPHIVGVDYNQAAGHIPVISQINTIMRHNDTITFFFYNTVNLPILPDTAFSARVFCFGSTVTDRDLSEIIVSPSTPSLEETRHYSSRHVAHAFEGKVCEDYLIDILQFIAMSKKTGHLIVENRLSVGSVYFKKGTITFAATAQEHGKNAVTQLLRLSEGYYKFSAGQEHSETNCNLSVPHILMESMKMIDEENRNQSLRREQEAMASY